MNFWKMNADGRNYIILNNCEETLPEALFPALARELCSPPRSLGADGCLVVDRPQGLGDFRAFFYDAQGTALPLSAGSGSCLCRYGFEAGLSSFSSRIETPEGMLDGQRINRHRYAFSTEDGQCLTADTKLVAKGEIFDEDLPALYWLLSGVLCANA